MSSNHQHAPGSKSNFECREQQGQKRVVWSCHWTWSRCVWGFFHYFFSISYFNLGCLFLKFRALLTSLPKMIQLFTLLDHLLVTLQQGRVISNTQNIRNKLSLFWKLTLMVRIIFLSPQWTVIELLAPKLVQGSLPWPENVLGWESATKYILSYLFGCTSVAYCIETSSPFSSRCWLRYPFKRPKEIFLSQTHIMYLMYVSFILFPQERKKILLKNWGIFLQQDFKGESLPTWTAQRYPTRTQKRSRGPVTLFSSFALAEKVSAQHCNNEFPPEASLRQ